MPANAAPGHPTNGRADIANKDELDRLALLVTCPRDSKEGIAHLAFGNGRHRGGRSDAGILATSFSHTRAYAEGILGPLLKGGNTHRVVFHATHCTVRIPSGASLEHNLRLALVTEDAVCFRFGVAANLDDSCQSRTPDWKIKSCTMARRHGSTVVQHRWTTSPLHSLTIGQRRVVDVES